MLEDWSFSLYLVLSTLKLMKIVLSRAKLELKIRDLLPLLPQLERRLLLNRH